ncbi:MAG: alpha/beta fold hydrolase [Bdellovibrionaceae bacterium]|nr:alpha/beta fold hydrolase [Bdellovibrionales bacterium]MCB9253773.1 alpha/beta fold hydrolase [Pseudobdellovibrionaceae bacterium]
MQNWFAPLRETLCPPRWARGGHSQTIFGHLWPSPNLDEIGERWEIPLGDGDTIVAFAHRRNPKFVVCLFHGLGGSAEADYIRRTTHTCLGLGLSVVRVNHRGCGEGEGLSAGPYHSGRGEDVSAALSYARSQFPDAFLLAIGFSLSGNALLLSLAGVRGRPVPDAAIAVNAPIDLADASMLMSRGLNRVYDFRFVRLCRESVHSRVRAGRLASAPDLGVWSTLREFDDLYTAPAGGFDDREDYYRTCSAAPHIEKIETPTMLLTAGDDPFVRAEHYRKLRLPPQVSLHIEAHGGHMGYLSAFNTPLGTKRWMDYALKRWIAGLAGKPST